MFEKPKLKSKVKAENQKLKPKPKLKTERETMKERIFTIEDAIAFATVKHKGQKDKNGRPYIYHLIGVMMRLETDEERMVGILHDVIEDQQVTPHKLTNIGCPDTVIQALAFVTKLPEEENDYNAFIERIATGPTLAIRVKLADLADNTDPARQTEDNEWTQKRMAKYAKAIKRLEGVLSERGM